MAERVVTAHVPDSLAREVDRLAERLDRPRGWVVKEALALYVELERKRHALTLEALADVDAGRVIEHGDVEAWAAKVTTKVTAKVTTTARPKRPKRRA
jgi:predicted transcriptional regulator